MRTRVGRKDRLQSSGCRSCRHCSAPHRTHKLHDCPSLWGFVHASNSNSLNVFKSTTASHDEFIPHRLPCIHTQLGFVTSNPLSSLFVARIFATYICERIHTVGNSCLRRSTQLRHTSAGITRWWIWGSMLHFALCKQGCVSDTLLAI